MDRNELIAQIDNADMVLVGLGEDFDNLALLKSDDNYMRGCMKLQERNMHSFLPAWAIYCTQKNGYTNVTEALHRLLELLKDKNYFVITVSTNHMIADVPWKYDRLVMPCGSDKKKQCSDGCGNVVSVDDNDIRNLEQFFDALYNEDEHVDLSTLLGTCSLCGQPMELNNIYTEHYNESGYLEKWSLYMKWLQGTVNRKLLILELGVGLELPSVIRWPFEKVAFYNQKSYFCRVHEKLYHLTAELNGKGCGISKNAIEWLRGL